MPSLHMLMCLLFLGCTLPFPSKGLRFLGKTPNYIQASFGANVDFDCQTNDDASTKISLWHTDVRFGNDSELSPSVGKLSVNGSKFTLHNILLLDFGLYKCMAGKRHQQIIKEFRLFPAVLRPSLAIIPSEQVIQTGGRASFTCEGTQGIPVWNKVEYVPGQADPRRTRMPQGYTNTVTQSPNKDFVGQFFKSVLSFQKASRSDTSLYECWLNKNVRKYARLTVRDPQAPHITKVYPSQYVEVREGRDKILICEVRGFPIPKVIWLKDGFHLPVCDQKMSGCTTGNSRYLKRNSNGLKITHVRYPEDNGLFTCLATNALGVDSRVINVKVKVAPEMGSNQKVYKRMNKGPVEIECKVKHSYPDPIFIWTRGLKEHGHFENVTKHDGVTIDKKGALTSVLHIPRDFVLPSKIYFRCNATNSQGYDFSQFTLIN